MRCESFSVRNLATGTSSSIRLPSGVRTKFVATTYVVAANTELATFTVASTAPAVTDTGTLAGLTITTRNIGSVVLTGAVNDDPMDPNDDTVVTITSTNAGTILLAIIHLWWS